MSDIEEVNEDASESGSVTDYREEMQGGKSLIVTTEDSSRCAIADGISPFQEVSLSILSESVYVRILLKI